MFHFNKTAKEKLEEPFDSAARLLKERFAYPMATEKTRTAWEHMKEILPSASTYIVLRKQDSHRKTIATQISRGQGK